MHDTWYVLDKQYDKHGRIERYQIQNTYTGTSMFISKEDLKYRMQLGRINMLNLKLSSDGKLVSKNMQETSEAEVANATIKNILETIANKVHSANKNIICEYKPVKVNLETGFLAEGALQVFLGLKSCLIWVDIDPTGFYYIYSVDDDLDEEGLRSYKEVEKIIYSYIATKLKG